MQLTKITVGSVCMATKQYKVGIVGATGYTGVELMGLLSQHPFASVVVATSRSDAGVALADMFPSLRGHTDLCFTVPDVGALAQCDKVFFATPHTVSMQMLITVIQSVARL